MHRPRGQLDVARKNPELNRTASPARRQGSVQTANRCIFHTTAQIDGFRPKSAGNTIRLSDNGKIWGLFTEMAPLMLV